MRFPSVDAAQAWSTKYGKMIYVEVEGAEGVLQVYPGGRKVFYGASMGKVYQRWRKRLTPDQEFDRGGSRLDDPKRHTFLMNCMGGDECWACGRTESEHAR